jgi:predicted nucleic acid-binding protein
MEEPVFLDTNIFIYAAGKPHRYKNPCLHILKDIETQKLMGVVNTEIFQELLYRYSHINLLEKGIQLCNDILEYPLNILSVNEVDIRTAIEIIKQYKDRNVKPRDAIHAAVLKNNKFKQIISADKDFDNFSFLTRIDPQEYTPKSD